ncbi:hypothetical protein RCC89_14140 [Cytophagaceae bacterium ABcell3]|nr:hypothetical protein RCC89_14140 [Cytophagaceae bacterium ABcell3]
MKRFIVLCTAIIISGISLETNAQLLQNAKNAVKSGNVGLSQQEAGEAIKEALNNGVQKGVEVLNKVRRLSK